MANWNAKFATGSVIGAGEVDIHEDLRLAIIERIQGADRSIPVLFNVEVVAGRLLETWYDAFQTEITALIPLYVNHQTSGGAYDGLSAIPMWDQADMLTAIGDGSRYSAPTVSQLTDKWIIQQHDILNLLRWTKQHNDFSAVSDARLGYGSGAVYNTTWNEAVTIWDADSYSGAGTRAFIQQTATAGRNLGGDFSINIDNYRGKLTAGVTGLYASGDCYLYTQKGSDEYNSTDGYAEDKMNYVETVAETLNSITSANYYLEDRNIQPVEPAIGKIKRKDCFGLSWVVLKFDGANGFPHRDW